MTVARNSAESAVGSGIDVSTLKLTCRSFKGTNAVHACKVIGCSIVTVSTLEA